jgi:hypothetical protein
VAAKDLGVRKRLKKRGLAKAKEKPCESERKKKETAISVKAEAG